MPMLYNWTLSWPWETRRRRAAITKHLAERDERIRQVRDRVANSVTVRDTVLRDQILSLPLLELHDALQSAKFTAVEVLNVYAWKALQVQAQLNCLCEFVVEAYDQAEALDAEFGGFDAAVAAADGKPKKKPPLFGIPFCAKNCFSIKGYEACVGLVAKLGTPMDKDCSLIAHLRKLGAIPFVTGNVPTLMMSYMTSNPVYGTSLHPLNSERTPGGSSGGDAAITAARGAPFGTGNDGGGSLRIPASFCGLVSLKQTNDRFRVRDISLGVIGLGRLAIGNGFFTHTVDEQVFLLSNILGSPDYQRELVPHSAPIPLDLPKLASIRGSLASKKKTLRIGYHWNDGVVPATPGCRRVVEEAVELLRAEGHEMVKFTIPDPIQALSFSSNCWLFDGKFVCDVFRAGEPVHPDFTLIVRICRLANWLRRLVAFFLRRFSPQMAAIISSFSASADDLRKMYGDLDAYVDNFINYWDGLQLDAVVCPAFSIPAPRHGDVSWLNPCFFATGLYNLVDFVAGVVPTGQVSHADDLALQDEAVWPTGWNPLFKRIRRSVANSAGLPLAVQVVTRPYTEELCLAVMGHLEALWRTKSA